MIGRVWNAEEQIYSCRRQARGMQTGDLENGVHGGTLHLFVLLSLHQQRKRTASEMRVQHPSLPRHVIDTLLPCLLKPRCVVGWDGHLVVSLASH